MDRIEVAAAVISKEGKFLITLRQEKGILGGYWEFPGGKKEPEESLETCLARELREELGIGITVGKKIARIAYDYPDRKVDLHFFSCDWCEGALQNNLDPEFRWVEAAKLNQYPFPPANAKLIEMLMSKGL
ncbi:MAG TPA: (deoxy)nucleoside triphosphate pyrophosphohydrolase [Nitrospiria bacterium]|nr:(deoxy)nucleoside triphosphate pyrophosphohydrolase [Nitrospiria bacterium]